MRADYLWWYDQQLSLKYLEYIATGFSAGQEKNVNYNGGVAALTVELRYWHVHHSPPRTMHGSCLCWRARRRKASWRESWPVSSSGCGRTEVFKPASAAPVNISSTTRQHSESQTHTNNRGNSCSQNCESPTEKSQWSHTPVYDFKRQSLPHQNDRTHKLLPFHCEHTKSCCHNLANTSSPSPQRAESNSSMHHSGL